MSPFEGLEHIVRQEVPLAPYTRIKVGGTAEYFAEPTSLAELLEVIQRANSHNIVVRTLGSGASLLIREHKIDGVLLHLSAPLFSEVTVEGDILQAGGGINLNNLIAIAAREGLSGLENLVGIAGTLGGALRNNLDGSGISVGGPGIGQWVEDVTVITRQGEVCTRTRSELQFSHRQSSLNELVILNARIKLIAGDKKEIIQKMQKQWILVKNQQPAPDHHLAFVFKDPSGYQAADLIDRAGLKGAKVGRVSVSSRNANYLEVLPGATSEEVLDLLSQVEATIEEKFEISLEQQLEIW
ncbi:MAG: UDP-N-acetylmuramate dehydrogenase [Pirellulaceae bacterium]|nr:UDP-N-acetylmuramate dehydrogenase [Pirellulaceae bacterium]